jgi:hypothetical protein
MISYCGLSEKFVLGPKTGKSKVKMWLMEEDEKFQN